MGVGLSAVGLSGRRTIGLSDYRAVGLSGRRNIRLENTRDSIFLIFHVVINYI